MPQRGQRGPWLLIFARRRSRLCSFCWNPRMLRCTTNGFIPLRPQSLMPPALLGHGRPTTLRRSPATRMEAKVVDAI